VHPWMRLLLGAMLIVTGVLTLLIGAGHGGLIAAGAFVLAGALTAIRGKAIRDAGKAQPREPLGDPEDNRP
jgi:hypothetical protein